MPGSRCPGGYNSFGSTLHWGPDYTTDAYAKTTTLLQYSKNVTSLTDSFHVYGLLWNETTIVTYLDDPKNVVLEVDVSETDFWTLGQTDTKACTEKDADAGGFNTCAKTQDVPANDWSKFANPWASPNNYSEHMAPFDAPFYLIMNVAVGGTNGFFNPDTCRLSDGSPLPWTDAPDELPQDALMKAAYQWLPTWVDTANIAWAAHCALGSAAQKCTPSGSSCPVKDMTQDGASAKLRSWYEGAAGKCTAAGSSSACAALGAACEWHASACPDISDDAALQVKSIKVFS